MGSPPARDIDAVRRATRLLLRSVADLTDEQVAAPSRLPGWSRAELMTHLARNADAGRGIAEAGARGETGYQYPGGREQRAAGISAGRGARAADVLADLRRSCDALMEAWDALPADAWDLVGIGLRGERTQRGWVWSRWRELEVHHVDLGLDYTASAWPVAFVNRGLEESFAELPERADRHRARAAAAFRVEAIDHDRAWVVRLERDHTKVEPVDDRLAAVDGTVTGWGCDVLAWLYGRDGNGAGLTASGDLTCLRIPEWFPFG